MDLFVYRGNLLIGSPERIGRQHFYRGISVRRDPAVGGGSIIVDGLGSYLQVHNNSFHWSDGTVDVGVKCINGGTARIHDNADTSITNTPGHLKVGSGAAISLGTAVGQFSEVAGFNKNFARWLETNAGGKPTGDLSRIYEVLL